MTARRDPPPPPVRVAYARHPDAAAAVRGCAAALGLDGDGPLRPRLVLAFGGGKLDPERLLAALRAEFGPAVPIVGGSAAGAITREGWGCSGFELGLAVFLDPAAAPAVVVAGGDLSRHGERAAGHALGERVAGLAEEGAAVLLLYDSVAGAEPLRLHPASLIVEGFREGLGGRRVHLVGGGLLTDVNLRGGWVLDGAALRRNAALALVFPPGVAADTEILHGCRPVSAFMEITRIEGADLYELDGEPALAVVERTLGLAPGAGAGPGLSLVATIGEKLGDPYAPFDENAYVNRLILSADPATGSITLFEPDFRPGTRVQVMSRDNALMLDSARRGAAALFDRTAAAGPPDGPEPLLALYIDCAGRASLRSGAAVEEAELVLAQVPPTVPFIGFYSGVEVAPFAGGDSRPLDWTGVLTVLRR